MRSLKLGVDSETQGGAGEKKLKEVTLATVRRDVREA